MNGVFHLDGKVSFMMDGIDAKDIKIDGKNLSEFTEDEISEIMKDVPKVTLVLKDEAQGVE